MGAAKKAQPKKGKAAPADASGQDQQHEKKGGKERGKKAKKEWHFAADDLETQLSALGLRVKTVAADGNCFFRQVLALRLGCIILAASLPMLYLVEVMHIRQLMRCCCPGVTCAQIPGGPAEGKKHGQLLCGLVGPACWTVASAGTQRFACSGPASSPQHLRTLHSQTCRVMSACMWSSVPRWWPT